ncbi:winged helix-turn-helix domain-containing protein [Cognatiyoonia sp. IB215446]|uniref:winged helix-turn-helix domain-containing protein n=1 Tax=Cognatiyoonia sp. IB215446 TaxID=3097355 RepID=UPI002A0CA873|nr:winged helix-turn-helix domain-containing protein [Cognatiyoonia sp. IB215446]MDX8346564.1 winged helix-turn-helix domain-containing protein [Cognatiyoonia sp. IB215446]
MSDWYFSENDARLICPEQVVQLTPKAAAVLSCLRRHANDVVGIDTFLKEVWPDTHVTPDLVREYIHDLRIALGDDAKQPKYIETVRGKGFRLVAEIEAASQDPTSRGAVSQEKNYPTIAVLKPTTGEDNQLAEIAEAVASDIINRLARFHYLGVVARQSTFSSVDITDIRTFARDVQASYVLESNFSRIGGVVRARLQLVDARTGQNLWGTRLDIDNRDPLAGIDAISNHVTLALTGWHGELHRAEFKSVTRKKDGDLSAFEHFVLGCDLEMRLDADSLRQSLAHLARSVELDPTFARAWLVYALELRWAYAVIPGRDRNYLERAKEAFETAYNLAPADPVNLALMSMNAARRGHIDKALKMLEQATTGMSGDSDAMICVATATSLLTDDVARASHILDTTFNVTAASPSWFHFAEACVSFMAGDYHRTVSSTRSAPREISALVFSCLAHAALGHRKEAVKAYDHLVACFPSVDLVRFGANLPIVSSKRLAEYNAAVDRLNGFLAATKTVEAPLQSAR